MSCFFDNLLPIMFALEVYVTEEVYITKRKINKISNFKQQQHKIHITCLIIIRIFGETQTWRSKLQKSSK